MAEGGLGQVTREQPEQAPGPTTASSARLGDFAKALSLSGLVGLAIKLVVLVLLVVVLWDFLRQPWLAVRGHFYEPQGYIFVDSPEVYTRERLINERLDEDQWLRARLDEADDPESLAGITRVIRERLDVGTADQAPEPEGKAADSGDTTSRPDEELLTYDQKVRLMSANRDFILQKIIENRLDDRHDLEGNSLYILKFDTTVVANDMSNRKAVVGIRILPPTTPLGAGKGQISSKYLIGLVKEEEPGILRFIRKSFDQFVKDSSRRLNNAVFRAATERDERLDDPVGTKKAVAQEFGIHEGDVYFSSSILSDGGESPTWLQYTLGIGGLADFVQYFALVPLHGTRTWTPVFSAQERSINFTLIDDSCIDARQKDDFVKQYPNHGGAAGTIAPELTSYFGTDRQVTLYLDQNAYLYNGPEARALLLDVLGGAMPPSQQVGDSSSAPWGTISLVEYSQASSQAEWRCPAIKGFFNTGFLKFVERVRPYNSYAYSVLPRQSPVSIVEETVKTSTARLSPGGAGGLLDAIVLAAERRAETAGASMQSRVTSFGDSGEFQTTPGEPITVGWIIDPRAGKVGGASDDLTTTTESVMAIVSVPAWWPSLQISMIRRWLEPDGSSAPAHHGGEAFAPRASGEAGEEMEALPQLVTVNLPNSQQLLESSLISGERRAPRITGASCEAGQREGGQKLACVIHGKRLWRNTVVTLGALKHEKLQVMPNMEGLLVEFSADASACGKDLNVWTSEGVTPPYEGDLCQAEPGEKPETNATQQETAR